MEEIQQRRLAQLDEQFLLDPRSLSLEEGKEYVKLLQLARSEGRKARAASTKGAKKKAGKKVKLDPAAFLRALKNEGAS